MHHKRRGRATTRREISRLDHHKVRRAEDAAVRGDHSRQATRLAWSWKSTPSPVLDVPSTGKTKTKKQRPPKKPNCPTSPKGRHEFLYDRGVFSVVRYSWESHEYDHSCEEADYKMCVHCGITLRKRRRWRRTWWYHDTVLRSV